MDARPETQSRFNRWYARQSPLVRQLVLIPLLAMIALVMTTAFDHIFRKPFGESCQSAGDCRSRLCSSGGFCTKYCRDGKCPDGFQCVESVVSVSSLALRDARAGIPVRGNSTAKICQQ
jgi:hypothetical protein